MTLLKPKLLDALSKADMGDASIGVLRGCPPPPLTQTDCVPVYEIGTVDLLRNYLTVELNSKLWPKLYTVFKKIMDGIWGLVKPVLDSFKSSLMVAVGSIPVVGGALSAAVSVIAEIVWFGLKLGIKKAFSSLRDTLQEFLVVTVVNGVFSTGLFTQEALGNPTADLVSRMESAADTAQATAVTNSQNDLLSKGSAAENVAEQEAVGVNETIETYGQEVERAEAASNTEDDDLDDEEESLDIEDEGDD